MEQMQNGSATSEAPEQLPEPEKVVEKTERELAQDKLYARFVEVDNDSLGEMYVDAYAQLAQLANKLAPLRDVLTICERVWFERLNMREATTIPNDNLDIQIIPGAKPKPTKLMDVLWTLRDLKIDGLPIPSNLLDEAVYVEPPIPEEHRRACNLTKLKALVKTYGKPVKDIFEKGVIYPTDAEIPKTLKVTIKEHRLKALQNG